MLQSYSRESRLMSSKPKSHEPKKSRPEACMLQNEVIRLSVMPTHDTYLDNGTATGLTADTLNIPLARANVNKNVTFLLLICCIPSPSESLRDCKFTHISAINCMHSYPMIPIIRKPENIFEIAVLIKIVYLPQVCICTFMGVKNIC